MKVYKINKQIQVGSTIVYIQNKLSDLEHENLKKIGKISDLVFVFSKSSQKIISPKKMSTLYGAIFYCEGKTDEEILEIWEMIDYLHELSEYYSISIVLQKDLNSVNEKEINSILRLQNSLIETSSFSSRSLTNQELQKIYLIPKKRIKIWKYIISIPKPITSTGMYITGTSDDHILFLRPISIKGIKLDLNKKDLDFISTFYGFGIKTFLSSLIQENQYLNLDITNAKI